MDCCALAVQMYPTNSYSVFMNEGVLLTSFHKNVTWTSMRSLYRRIGSGRELDRCYCSQISKDVFGL